MGSLPSEAQKYSINTWNTSVLYIYGTWPWSSLCLQMSQHLTVLGHQHTHCWLQTWIWFLQNFCDNQSFRLTFCMSIIWCHSKSLTCSSENFMQSNIKYYGDVIMSSMTSQITSLMIDCSKVYSAADQKKHQSSASLAFVWGVHQWPVNSLHKWPVTWKMFPFDDVIMD